MESSYSYNTIDGPILDVILKEKGSKFISYAYPVLDEEQLKQRLEEIKSLHPKATHHCYAFRLGLKGENYRANDDGEPSGSAGLPIYNQLLRHNITNVLLIVVRYYGGTKLGVGGLVKVYKESAKQILDYAQIVTKELEKTLILEFDFGYQNQIFTLLNKFNAKVVDFHSTTYGRIKALVRLKVENEMMQALGGMLKNR
ncbi:YigZ family protein [Elizabethkingia argentiflava]|uniref:YigZ family protein n=1 Tax=Elizabethkingia argenteiflava TaxID=2681556 RepID=A0A845PUK1_9FLAO|nr:YigZ family protein [Elizabethkingia argenteiflava]NAW49948.1 YigZ family protein [Elizabethkingia argenteiflava]